MTRPRLSEHSNIETYFQKMNQYVDYLLEENAQLSRYAKELSDSMREYLKNFLSLNPETSISDLQKVVRKQIAQQFQSEN